MIIKNLLCTCGACPSQWDAITDDGRAVYIRYRHGTLRLHVGAHGDTTPFAAVKADPLHVWPDIGDSLDGMMTEDELQRFLAGAGIQLELSSIQKTTEQWFNFTEAEKIEI